MQRFKPMHTESLGEMKLMNIKERKELQTVLSMTYDDCDCSGTYYKVGDFTIIFPSRYKLNKIRHQDWAVEIDDYSKQPQFLLVDSAPSLFSYYWELTIHVFNHATGAFVSNIPICRNEQKDCIAFCLTDESAVTIDEEQLKEDIMIDLTPHTQNAENVISAKSAITTPETTAPETTTPGATTPGATTPGATTPGTTTPETTTPETTTPETTASDNKNGLPAGYLADGTMLAQTEKGKKYVKEAYVGEYAEEIAKKLDGFGAATFKRYFWRDAKKYNKRGTPFEAQKTCMAVMNNRARQLSAKKNGTPFLREFITVATASVVDNESFEAFYQHLDAVYSNLLI